MKKFLFITHLTPLHKQSFLREKLFEIYLTALNSQTYKEWKVLMIGEKEALDGKIKTVKIDTNSEISVAKQLFKIYQREDVIAYLSDADYVIKLDDDDIISPTILEQAAKLDFDVYFDEWHTFYDVSSGQINQQRRDWIASTCIHSAKHAFANLNDGEKNYYSNSVLYSDHSVTWHRYYADKTKIIAEKEHPVYLRVLSPTSITAGAKKMPLESVSEVQFDSYYKYLRSFGTWRENTTIDFQILSGPLENAWVDFAGKKQELIPIPGGWEILIDRLLNYGKAIGRIFR